MRHHDSPLENRSTGVVEAGSTIKKSAKEKTQRGY